ncbi:NUDIX domain-containing protein [Pseudomonas juntendi]|uniref:NUDIX domain-containing protein n=1 Tax=Pseudomonas juntendi TaxID=2666183 RepID=UPI001F38EC84|nr:NUDIX domain-containing protein [Pseudomonas juntendi]MCO7058313.1 NUDIX domain-containing protein [Pseudomonas juntendi]UJM15203.1 NUDIX domain-containing protein [Pseudomonas juntendi]
MASVAELLERLEAVTKGAKQPRFPKGSPKGGQFKPKGGGGGFGSGPVHTAQQALAQAKEALGATLNAAPHPKADDAGNPVTVHFPTTPSPRATWVDRKAVATFAPGSSVPKALNGVPLTPWTPPTTKAGWNAVAGQMPGKEPPLPQKFDYQGNPKRPGAGVVIQEPDGRVWVVEPTNHFGGYEHTFPKGGAEPGIKRLQANAIKEAWEESGLKVEITGILGDYEGDTSVARYYTAKRVGGTPADAGWETQGVKLVPPMQLGKHLNRMRDKQIAIDLLSGPLAKAEAERATRIADFVAELLKRDGKGKGKGKGGNAKQARYPKGDPRGGQFKPKGGGAMASAAPGAVGAAAKPGAEAVTAAQAIAGAKAQLGAFAPTMLTGKNPDNSALKAANKKIQAIAAMANDGDIVGLHAIKPTEPGKGANPYQKGVWNEWQKAVGHAQGLSSAGTTPGTGGKAAARGPMTLGDLKYSAPKPGGSNPGAIYTDASGAKWLVKGTKGNPDMAHNEVLASRLYNAAGAHAPEMRPVDLGTEHGGGTGVASRMLDGPLEKVNASPQNISQAQKHFAVDAWLANWDAVGLGFDNIAVTGNGTASRIDPGGALLYRAQGAPKGAAFNKHANEWDTLRDAKSNPQSAAVFAGMTSTQLAQSAARLDSISEATIKQLVDKHGPGDAKAKAELADTLIARKEAIMLKGYEANPTAFNEALVAGGGSAVGAKAAAAQAKAAAKPATAPVKVKAAEAPASFAIPPAPTGAPAALKSKDFEGSSYQKTIGVAHMAAIETKMKQGGAASAEAYLKGLGPGNSVTEANNLKTLANWVAAQPGATPAAAGAKVNSSQWWAQKHTELKGMAGQPADKIQSFMTGLMDTLGDRAVDMAQYESIGNLAGALKQGGAARVKATAAVQAATSAAAAAKPAAKKPNYTATAPTGLVFWNKTTKALDDALAAGDTEHAQKIINDVQDKMSTAKSPNNKANMVKFMAYAAGQMPTPTSARAKATAAVESATAAAVATTSVPKVAPAMPSKPATAALSSAANPNKTLLAKVDQVEAIGAGFHAGKLSKADAEAQLAAITFGSNTYGKKAAAYKADTLAAIGGADITPAAVKAAAGKPKTLAGAAQEATAAAAAVSAKAKAATKGAVKIDPKRLTEAPDFHNWNGAGKGLSSKAENNKANQDEVGAIHSMAVAGNLQALKAYQPQSPSKHVASYLQQVIEDVNLQLNPPPPLKSIDVGSGKTMAQAIKALAEQAKPLKSPQQVLAKLALYPVLGKAEGASHAAVPQTLKHGAGLTQGTYAAQSSANFAKLDSTKQNAVRAYTGAAYHDINASFRSGKPSKQALDAHQGILDAGVTLKPGTVLSRKVNMSAAMVDQIVKSGSGKIIQEFGISSTSISPKVWGGNVHFRMTAGDGVKGLYAGTGSSTPKGETISKHPGELEVLLPANQRMVVTAVHHGGQSDGYGSTSQIVVDVTLLPNS